MFLFHLPAVSRIDPPPAPLVALARRALECARRRAGVPEDSPPFFLSRVDLLPKDGRGASGGGASGGGASGEGASGGGQTDTEGEWLISEIEIGWPELFLQVFSLTT